MEREVEGVLVPEPKKVLKVVAGPLVLAEPVDFCCEEPLGEGGAKFRSPVALEETRDRVELLEVGEFVLMADNLHGENRVDGIKLSAPEFILLEIFFRQVVEHLSHLGHLFW